jgi:ribosomal protein L14E/L6E/L27E
MYKDIGRGRNTSKTCIFVKLIDSKSYIFELKSTQGVKDNCYDELYIRIASTLHYKNLLSGRNFIIFANTSIIDMK